MEETVVCTGCGTANEPLTRTEFSFNKPSGACPTCSGLGIAQEINLEKLIDWELSIDEGGVKSWNKAWVDYNIGILAVGSEYYSLAISKSKPLKDFTAIELDYLFYGAEDDRFSRHFPDKKIPKTVSKGKYPGLLTAMWRSYKENGEKAQAAEFFESKICPTCQGERLREEARASIVHGKRLPELSLLPLSELNEWLESMMDTFIGEEENEVLTTVLYDMHERLGRILEIGLGYLTLDRQAITLSGGESQRLRLASILGSGLTGVLYILDEPTAGLHPKDTHGLITVMEKLRDIGNTLLVIEHDETVMKAADHLVDMGPGAGKMGGYITATGTIADLIHTPGSITGRTLANEVHLPSKGRKGNGQYLTVHQATQHNLNNVTVDFPLETLTAITGVSGSGKSTLLFDVLADQEGCTSIAGLEAIDSIISIGQSPLARMSRSIVATYSDMYTDIRNLFAKQPSAKNKGLKANHFSFNTKGGRCDTCEGMGKVAVNLHFLSNTQVTCPDCKGKRFKDEILEVTLEGHSISDILEMNIEDVQPLLPIAKIQKRLQLLIAVGLGYLSLGQELTTLSGGEGQRLKLAKELSGSQKGHTLYLLDEPTSGLHTSDLIHLYELLQRLVDSGNTVLMVEHNVPMISASDYIIDMGPGGGDAGGNIIATGTPKELKNNSQSVTGPYLIV
ncbi:excinuclease ABC subunit UvrA [Lacticigenium naphthae]|uniref:excinuclease ABC subunit UvrA n=1 Tax=Lacticigenium naphthae TaxID=515351 RepID=UPI003CCB75B8